VEVPQVGLYRLLGGMIIRVLGICFRAHRAVDGQNSDGSREVSGLGERGVGNGWSRLPVLLREPDFRG
jgi:hypothetical protein